MGPIDWLRRFLLLENVSSILAKDMIEIWEKIVEAILLQSIPDRLLSGRRKHNTGTCDLPTQ